ncbi:PIR protein CIR protein [Plasmodium vinckei vinckei]|uniref:PIR protein CIR protein n=1 Tax=Plasmodium vinckei vinckei TaxID=54757 RepID=A0A449BMV0_PLAVN|nr:PIR protein CIR protein [Plasmodium vinckei vinckei]VEV54742.1 PIR protein CIR protein [Plasmodium vinckei vinckei]
MVPHNLQCEPFCNGNKDFSNIGPDFNKFNLTNKLHILYGHYDQTKSKDKRNAYSEEIITLGIWLIQKLLVIYRGGLIYENYKNYYEHIVMHLKHNTYMIKNDGDIPLNPIYHKLLDAFSLKSNYLILLDYNNKYIKQFYMLFDKLCNTINEYTENGYSNQGIAYSSANCINMYRIIYNIVNKSNFHLYLLENLKNDRIKFIISSINDSINEKRNCNFHTKLKRIENNSENNSYFKKTYEEFGCQDSIYQNINSYNGEENMVIILGDSKYVLKYLNASDHKIDIGTKGCYKTCLESFNSQKNCENESGNLSEISLCELNDTNSAKEYSMCELPYHEIGLKRNEVPLICCADIYSEHTISNIAVAAISISVVVSIIYKYLSLGCPENPKKKKKDENVIKSINGEKMKNKYKND